MFQIKPPRGFGRNPTCGSKSSFVVLQFNYQANYRAHRHAVFILNEHISFDIDVNIKLMLIFAT